ncbi:DUF3971 domain-containing protein [Pelagibacteraceae bacterium]|nr:DUF3971 domain-containing protein [Pelagibacteraceae bacterium]
MKKFLYLSFLIFLLLFSSIAAYLSTIGIETSKFNNLIVKSIKENNPRVEIELEKIKIKLDIKKIQLFLSTENPKIIYQNIKIPITEIKIYTKINTFLNSKIQINQILFKVEKFKTKDIKKIAIRIKPSNFKTYLLNNINGGEVEKAFFDLNTNKNFNIVNYKAGGTIKKINAKITSDVKINNISFNFKIDNNLTLINSINAKYEGVLISNGSIDIQRKKEIEIKGKFNSQFNLKEDQLNKFFLKEKFFKENKIKTKGSLIHDFNLKINNNFKITDYNYKSSGNISQSQIILKNHFKSKFIKKTIKKILFENVKLKIIFNKKNKNLLLFNGLYSFNDLNYQKFEVNHNLNKKNQNYLINLDLAENIFFEEINFQTGLKKISNIKVEYSPKNKKFNFKTIYFTEGKNIISVKDLVLNRKKVIEKLSSIKIQTFDKNQENNNFIINFEDTISILGDKYDSTNLLKLMSSPGKSSLLKNFSKEVEIQIKNLITESKIPLSNFNLIGSIEKGKFNKISAKSEFSEDKYLDISLKKDPNNKKILEVYSDFPQALISGFKFFEGIKDGKLLYNSEFDEKSSVSKLTIEDFKIIKAPAFATLLALADLGGVTDLLKGQGMSFDILQIDLKENENVTTIKELLALGPSVSLHMEGYIEKKTGLISLSGTLVPAKMLNSLVSKIPVVGSILVGDKVGEGVFGVSFKMKGLPRNIKTTVNPVKTITPRFITRALEKIKKN